jgi:fatty acid amide hydrolase 2
MAGGRRPDVGGELLRWLTGRGRHTAATLEYFLGEELFRFVRGKAQYVQEGKRLAARLEALLGDDAVLLMPPHPRCAAEHHWQLLRPFDFSYTGIFNVLRLPVTAVPMGLGAAGLPLGVQVAAGYGRDHLAIAAALALEEAFGGYVPPKAAFAP